MKIREPLGDDVRAAMLRQMDNPKIDRASAIEYRNEIEWDDALRSALKELDEARAERDALRAKLEKAVRYLRQGKAQFAPHTTNSDVDVFLSQIDGGEGNGRTE